MAVWMKIWFSQMMGVDVPYPGSFSFHFTLLSSLHEVGGSAFGATPVAVGPRHCGQFWSAETPNIGEREIASASKATSTIRVFILRVKTELCRPELQRQAANIIAALLKCLCAKQTR